MNIYVQITDYLFNKDNDRKTIIGKLKAWNKKRKLLKLLDSYIPSDDYDKFYHFLMDFVNFYGELNRGFLIGIDHNLKEVIKVSKRKAYDNMSTTHYSIKIITNAFEGDPVDNGVELFFNDTDREIHYKHFYEGHITEEEISYNSSSFGNGISDIFDYAFKEIINGLDNVHPYYSRCSYKLLSMEMINFAMSENTLLSGDSVNVDVNRIKDISIKGTMRALIFPVTGTIYLPELAKCYSFNGDIVAKYADFSGKVEIDPNYLNHTIHNVLNKELIFGFKNFTGWLYDTVYDQAVSMTGVDFNDQ